MTNALSLDRGLKHEVCHSRTFTGVEYQLFAVRNLVLAADCLA